MKPGDLVKDIETGIIGVIVDLEMLINDHPVWNVLTGGEILPVRERYLEPIDDIP